MKSEAIAYNSGGSLIKKEIDIYIIHAGRQINSNFPKFSIYTCAKPNYVLKICYAYIQLDFSLQ